MAELYSQYASGLQFTAGVLAGSSLGVSGLNPVVDRLNSISDTNAVILPAVTTPITPIGTIVAWLKSFTNTPSLPDGWVECDGSVLSDAESVYNGQTLPDLNGDNRFLRGNSTSGGTGGGETHTHGDGSYQLKLGDGYGLQGTTGVGRIVTTESPEGSSIATTDGFTTEDRITGGTGTDKYWAGASAVVEGTSAASSTLPTYYNVVWIMRIK